MKIPLYPSSFYFSLRFISYRSVANTSIKFSCRIFLGRSLWWNLFNHGATIGSWFSFILTRSFFGQILTKKTEQQWVNKFQKGFKKHGWKFSFCKNKPNFSNKSIKLHVRIYSISSKAFIVTTFIFLLLPSIVIALIEIY